VDAPKRFTHAAVLGVPVVSLSVKPHTEYNIGNYSRSFKVSSEIEQDGIKAELRQITVT
jgi:hypothetical protein